MKVIYLISLILVLSCGKSGSVTGSIAGSGSETEAGGNSTSLKISLHGNNGDLTIHEVDVIDNQTILIPGRIKNAMSNGSKVFAGWCSGLPCDFVSDRDHIVGEEFTISGAYDIYALWVNPTANWATASNGNLVVPNAITEIAANAFSNKNFLSLIISDTVTSVGNNAFVNNYNLEKVTIPNSVTTIGVSAFAVCGLNNVIIPNSVTTIGNNAFMSNFLTSVKIPNSVTTIGKGTFQLNELTSVTIPNSVVTIEENAFNVNKLTSVTIPNSVTTIGINAFTSNQITTVTIGAGVTMDSTSIPNSFSAAYAAFGKIAGTYTWNGASWVAQ